MFCIKKLFVTYLFVIAFSPDFIIAMDFQNDPAFSLYLDICRASDSQEVQYIIKQAVQQSRDENKKQYILDTGLRIAIDGNNFKAAEAFLACGANPNAAYSSTFEEACPESTSLLEHYARHESASRVKFLLEHGADPFHYNENGQSALHLSTYNDLEQTLEIVPLLVKRVGVHYRKNDYDKKTILHLAAAEHNIPLIKKLLQLGADQNCKDHAGRTALEDALSPNYSRGGKGAPEYFKTIKLLYKNGANTDPSSFSLYLTREQIAELKLAREQFRTLLAPRDCDYLEQPYPYPSDDQLEEDQLPYKDLYNNVFGEYLPLPKSLIAICSGYSGNAELGALLDSAYADAEAGDQRSSL